MSHKIQVNVGCGKYREIVPQQLHNQSAVLVRLFVECVELGDGIVESRFGESAGLSRRVIDLVVEDGEVKRESQSNRVSWCHLCLRDVKCTLVPGG